MSQTANKSMEHNYEIAEKSPQPPFEGNMMVREVIMVQRVTRKFGKNMSHVYGIAEKSPEPF
jgi:hypothetical protein